MRYAITRAVSSAINQCELTHFSRTPIDLSLARKQHHAYEAALQSLGCQLIPLPEEPTLPDSVFVEDAAVVLDEVALITRPGAASRRPETPSIAAALTPYRKLIEIQSPGTVDGGDVLRVGKSIYVGLSSRSNQEAVEQMAKALQPWGYRVHAIQVNDCLHLKSAVTQVAADKLLVNPAWLDPAIFGDMQIIEIDPSEEYAANTVWIDDAVIYPTCYPQTQRKLEAQGIRVCTVDVGELIKAEGAVTCCSLLFV
jgi:dimethylargininase